MDRYTLYNEMQSLLTQKEKLDERISAIREELKVAIPANGTIDGITHVVTPRRTTQWAEAAKRIIDLLVADSKKGRAWTMIEQLTKTSETHSYRPSDQALYIPREDEKMA